MAGGFSNWLHSIGRDPGMLHDALNAIGVRHDPPAASQPQVAGATPPQASPLHNLLSFIGLVHDAPAQTPQQASDQITGISKMSPAQLAHMNMQARAAGFPSYEAMALHQHAMRMNSGATPQGGGSFGDVADNAMAWHPAKTIQFASDRLADVNAGMNGN